MDVGGFRFQKYCNAQNWDHQHVEICRNWMIRNRQSFIVSERVLSSAAQERCICHGHFSFSDEDEPTLAGLQPEDATEGDRDLHKTLTKSTGKSLFWMGKYGKDIGNIYHEMSGNG